MAERRTSPPLAPRFELARPRAAERGFTLAEVLLSIIVFTISVVGVVAVQRATLASQENALQMRAAQRIAQHEVEEFKAVGFNDLIALDFQGNAVAAYPYDDFDLLRTEPYRWAPTDIDLNAAGAPRPPGMRANHFRVFRRVTAMPEATALPTDPLTVQALQLEVWVLWIDHNPSFPPPDWANVQALVPDNIDPASPLFQPWARGVQLSTIRANDGDFDEAGTGGGGPAPTGGP